MAVHLHLCSKQLAQGEASVSILAPTLKAPHLSVPEGYHT